MLFTTCTIMPIMATQTAWLNMTQGAILRGVFVFTLITVTIVAVRLLTTRIRRRNDNARLEVESRQQTEAALRLSEAQYRNLFCASVEGLLVVDQQGHVIMANPAAETLMDCPSGALEGRSIDDLLIVDEQEYAQAQREDGSTVPVRVQRVPFGEGQSLVSLSDVGPLLELQSRLAQGERLEALGRLAGGVAHDFNNLLTALRASVSMLRNTVSADNALGQESLAGIEQVAERGTALTRQLLAFGRRQLLRPRVVDPVALILDLKPMISRMLRDDIVVVTEIRTQRRLAVRVDSAQLDLAIANLLINASEAMPDGGQIRVDVDERDQFVLIAVEDAGRGIEADALPRIFEPFFTTKDGAGSGLGLASVHGFVAQSGGDIVVRSEPGRGTRFEMLLPRVDAHLDEEDTPWPSTPAGGTERLLLVDDDEGVLRTVQRVLMFAGYQVLTAADGLQALQMLERHKVALLITDVLMPNIHGVELAAQARQRHADVRIIYMSGYTDDILPESTEGTETVLSKPFLPEDLLRAVRRELQRP